MSTPAPDSTASRSAPADREANGREANGHEANGSTPRVKVTRGSLPRGSLGSTARRLFREPIWKPRQFVQSQLSEFKNMQLWRAAILEGIFTGMWIFLSILAVSESVNWGTSLPGRTILVVSFLHVVIFFIYILTAVTLTGNDLGDQQVTFPHLNPAITFMLVLSRAQGLVGGLLIIIFQCVGGILASLAAKELIPRDRIDRFLLGGCFGRRTIHFPNGITTEIGFSDHKYFLIEFLFSFTFLYTTAVMFTTRKLRVLGLKLGVFLISLNIGLNVYLSSSIRQGYSGAVFNPARCLGPAVAYGQPLWDRLWPPFFAPFVASFAVAFLFATLPPDHAEVYAEKKDMISKFRQWSPKRPTRRGGDDFEPGSSLSLDDPDLENTVYEVPSAGRLFSASPDTPGAHPPPEPADAV